MNSKEINILMCGSDYSVGGGMVSVARSYINYKNWKNKISITYIPTHKNGSNFYKICYFIKAVFKIRNCIKENNIQIAHLHTTVGGSFFRKSILLLLLKKKDIKIILHHHTDYSEFYSCASFIKKHYMLKILEMADLNLVLGECFEEKMHKWSKAIKIKILYNGVNVECNNHYNLFASNILFLGWLNKKKGIDILLEAIRILDLDGLDDKVGVYLCGKENDYVRELINTYNIQHRIRKIGFIQDDEKKKIFSDVFVNVLPSNLEGLPLAILETMNYGIPNIASNIAAIPEIIEDGNNGYLIIPGDAQMLAIYIKQILNDIEFRETMSKKAKETIQTKFDIRKIAIQLENMYLILTE